MLLRTTPLYESCSNRRCHKYTISILRTGIILPTAMRGRSRWPRGLRRGSTAARVLGMGVRIPPGAWMSVSCECCVLSGTHL